ncbi:type I-U CRISPR-associated protein Cas8c [Chloracidobacterium thermophilum]|uniref:type I-G CRISPR-associated protein Cas8g2 n=1 Tax=Chloracidobacterium thermophilum TaxID=458033 RepID=UPI000738580E|nr:type I-U CRISPR-associated protein Cas8c [Chloracidobacterium thermophilum]
MAQESIPVNLLNPGQVFACMGFLEAADMLLGEAKGRFDWKSEPSFEICAGGEVNPVEAVLEFLVEASLTGLIPDSYEDLPSANKREKVSKHSPAAAAKQPHGDAQQRVPTFPNAKPDQKALPLRLERNGEALVISHWCDASSRGSFKLFAGQQSSNAIASQMQSATKKLWNGLKEKLIKDPLGHKDPLGLTVPLVGSSFKLDARKSWTSIDAGYSPDEQSHKVLASPVVELLAAIGLEQARPDEFKQHQMRYGVWQEFLPPILARAALGAVHVGVPLRIFRFTIGLSGKNKIVTFAQEETNL